MATLASGKLSEMFEDFLKSVIDREGNYVYRVKISSLISSEGKSLPVDFGDLLKYNSDLANRLLLEPDSSLAAFKTAAFETMRSENALYADRVKRELVVRIRGITDQVPLRKVDTSYIDKMLATAGMVVRTSELRPLLTEAAWTCQNGHVTYQEQDDYALKRPAKCELCGEMRNFELDRRLSRFRDFQIVRIQELPEELPPGQLPQFFDVNVEGDVVGIARPGDRVVLTGIVRAVPDYSPGQVRTRLFRSQIDCNQVEVKGKEPETVLVTKEDEALIKTVAGSPEAYDKLIASIAPAIMGHLPEKEAILLLLAGGSATILPDGTKLRGDINVLFVGDPGMAKSEMLKFAAQVAPRGIFASGRGTTAAGLSAAVIREKNVLMLEAGVVVLADQGIACIDEFDKMKPEDRSALHEQMEQQSYHPSTEILLTDGSKPEIGKLVDGLLESNGDLVTTGVDCEFLPVRGMSVYSVGENNQLTQSAITRISRHVAPQRFLSIRYSNGREVVVTPEHPVFVFRSGKMQTIPASEIAVGDFAPAPRLLPSPVAEQQLIGVEATGRKNLIQASVLSPSLGRILGYLVSEGNFYQGSSAEVDFTNLDGTILEDMRRLMEKTFGIKPTLRLIRGAPAGLRYVSTTLLSWFRANFPEIVKKARDKRAPKSIRSATLSVVREFLAAAFLGDGSVETEAVCFRTASPRLAEDYQDLLAKFGVASRISRDSSNDSYKTYVAGHALGKFFSQFVEEIDPRRGVIMKLVLRSGRANRGHDIFPTDVARNLIALRNDLGIAYTGGFWNNLRRNDGITRGTVVRNLDELESKLGDVGRLIVRGGGTIELRQEAGWSQAQVARICSLTRSSVNYFERGGYETEQRAQIERRIKIGMEHHLDEVERRIAEIRALLKLDFKRVRKVEEIPNSGKWATRWVYDVTVEPTHSFVSAGMLLHNSVTIAKGGIYAQLNARTAILAATNPILGKYNPFQNLTENINLPIPLLTRFDLIFVIKDQPAPAEDERLASHILSVHARKSYTTPPPVEFKLLKKYLAYARKLSPSLTKDATDRLKDYYLELRKNSGEEGQIPPTPRTLESLIRVSTARARVLLREEVTEEDALAAIALMNRMVQDVLTDATTKKTDFGIQLGKPVGETKNLKAAMEVFRSIEGADKKPVERKNFKEELLKSKFSDDDAEKMIRTMFREGLIYESRPGFFRRVGA